MVMEAWSAANGTPPGPVTENEPQFPLEVTVVFAIFMLAGKLSVRLVSVSGLFESLLRMDIVSVVVWPTNRVFGPKLLLKEGG